MQGQGTGCKILSFPRAASPQIEWVSEKGFSEAYSPQRVEAGSLDAVTSTGE